LSGKIFSVLKTLLKVSWIDKNAITPKNGDELDKKKKVQKLTINDHLTLLRAFKRTPTTFVRALKI
jgi:hypothetical protein